MYSYGAKIFVHCTVWGYLGMHSFHSCLSLEKNREQERRDARLARQASEREARLIGEKKRREEELSQREAQRIAERDRFAPRMTCESRTHLHTLSLIL